MGLMDGLYIGRSAIDAARAGVQLTGHNISNVDTEGYHRQRLETAAVTPPLSGGGFPIIGGGVEVVGSSRTVDRLLARQVNDSLSQESQTGTREMYMLQVESAVGQLGEGGLGAAVSELMAQLSALSSAPEDLTVRGQVVAAAEDLSTSFNRVASALSTVVEGAHAEVQSVVAEINSRASTVAELNALIVQAEASGQEASDLRDRRDMVVAGLAQRAGTTTFVDNSGHVSVMLGGHNLVQGEHNLTLQAVQAGDGTSQIQLSMGSSNVDITSSASGGKLGGLLSVQQTVVQTIMPRVDQLAYDLATRINTQHQAGFDLNGAAAGAMFTAPGAPAGAAAGMSVLAGLAPADIAAAAATGATGDNGNAILLAGMAQGLLAGGGTATFGDEAATIVGQVGTLTAEAMRQSAVATDELTYMESLQASSDGVSLDEEMVRLIQYQRSYQAGVKVLHVIDSLLERLIAL